MALFPRADTKDQTSIHPWPVIDEVRVMVSVVVVIVVAVQLLLLLLLLLQSIFVTFPPPEGRTACVAPQIDPQRDYR